MQQFQPEGSSLELQLYHLGCDKMDFGHGKAEIIALLGKCPRIGILVKIETFSKNKHSHIFDIGI